MTYAPADEHRIGQIANMTQEMGEHADASARLAAERAVHVRALRAEGWSLGKIATATGLSRARVQQIAGPAGSG